MFVLLQVYPPEAAAEDGSDENCCLDVIAVDPAGDAPFWMTRSNGAAGGNGRSDVQIGSVVLGRLPAMAGV
jgi:hypothetical protein